VPVEAFHVDHKVPLARGGEHSYENVQPAHPFCNGSKGSGRKKSTKKKGR
jgi:5-methylcytosine-specific restriction endonuclease McrA